MAELATRPQFLSIRCDVEDDTRDSFHPTVVASIDLKRVVSNFSSFVHAASVVTRCEERALFSLQPSLLPSIGMEPKDVLSAWELPNNTGLSGSSENYHPGHSSHVGPHATHLSSPHGQSHLVITQQIVWFAWTRGTHSFTCSESHRCRLLCQRGTRSFFKFVHRRRVSWSVLIVNALFCSSRSTESPGSGSLSQGMTPQRGEKPERSKERRRSFPALEVRAWQANRLHARARRVLDVHT